MARSSAGIRREIPGTFTWEQTAESYSSSICAAARSHRRERPHRKPDRVAMWAVLMGLALAIGAATSSHAAVLTHVARAFGH